MMLGLLLYLAIYGLFLFVIVGIGCRIQWRKEKRLITASNSGILLHELVVLIPFRDEKKRIGQLIESINASLKHPREYVFIDDHSEDGSAEYIHNSIAVKNYRIVSLPPSLEGKKHAIRFGIQQTESTFILGLDADVWFNQDYFCHISALPFSDASILPAILLPKSWWQRFFELDLVLVNAINCGMTGLHRPLIASGANLLYRREAFLAYDRFDSHLHMPSGDDIYLLRDFRNAGASIQLVSHPGLAVYSETPQSMNEFLHQRLRWIAKTGDVGDHLSTVLSVVQFVLTLLFVVLAILFLWDGAWVEGLFLVSGKITLDMLLFYPFFKRQKRVFSWVLIPLYEFIFPIYSLVIAASMYAVKPVWKGRKLETNF